MKIYHLKTLLDLKSLAIAKHFEETTPESLK
jgi:hypothetical protein